jgi:hypothetical protein
MKGLFSSSDTVVSVIIFAVGAFCPVFDQLYFHESIDVDTLGLFLAITSIATIWVPGSGMSRTEGWQKWFLTNATMALLGAASGAIGLSAWGNQLAPTSAFMGMGVCICVFISFWSQGHQSRFHMMEVFEKTKWDEKYKHLNLLLGTMESSRIRRADLSHHLRQTVMDQDLDSILNEDAWRRLETVVLDGTTGTQRAKLVAMLAEVQQELKSDLPQLRVASRE